MLINTLETEAYPNPSHGQFSLKIVTSQKSYFTIEIYNNIGSAIWKKQQVWVDGFYILPVDLRGLPSGIYMIRVYNSTMSGILKLIVVQ